MGRYSVEEVVVDGVILVCVCVCGRLNAIIVLHSYDQENDNHDDNHIDPNDYAREDERH